MQRWTRTVPMVAALLALSSGVFALTAQSDSSTQSQTQLPTRAEVEQEASKLFNKVMSPFCPGRTIANCPSPQAAQLQVAIKDKLSNGESPEAIEEELYATFGDELRAIPRARGFNLLAWGIPGLFFVLGLVILSRWLRGLGPTPSTQSAGAAQVDRELDERLKKELEAIGE